MPSQRVIRINGPRNSVENLKEFQESVPEPTKYEVLVRVHGVSLNYRDIGVATSLYPFPVKDNVVPCSDAAGVVVKVGEGVKNVTVGDHGGPIDGVLREYVCIPAASAVQVPKESALSFCEWSTLVCTGVTAWNALYGNIPLRPGQTVLFQGTGGVSITGLILAKAAGARTIITSSSDEKLKRVQADYGWSKEVLRLTQGQGVDYIFENGGSGTIGESLNAVKMGGNISVIGFLSQADQAKMPDVAALALSKGAVVRGITVGSTQLLQEVTRFVATRGLRLPVDKVFDFNEKAVVEAYKYAASGAQIGKVCIKVA
ncbi:zinc-dependent alcohol dehydrogenase family protein [Aspergillus aculeatinus CBS 121060]|uniref:NAD(P)-binding protein n=1 Tax=Aspergillus aculeatinus CBS 121060 TaxID=1448322 RepID=A0ACD1H9M9_9EURO|nr:NAD(P)-binding protein [Aspergillus aculeatinus CBS 121060]RAH70506.1 NAD(P)-binding protein [Aspergillus aculeatinus CBS 121060]